MSIVLAILKIVAFVAITYTVFCTSIYLLFSFDQSDDTVNDTIAFISAAITALTIAGKVTGIMEVFAL